MNGIIIGGKVYEAVRCDSDVQCKTCCFNREFGCDCHPCEIVPCRLFDYTYNFRYSQELTDKISGDERHKQDPRKCRHYNSKLKVCKYQEVICDHYGDNLKIIMCKGADCEYFTPKINSK